MSELNEGRHIKGTKTEEEVNAAISPVTLLKPDVQPPWFTLGSMVGESVPEKDGSNAKILNWSPLLRGPYHCMAFVCTFYSPRRTLMVKA